VILEKSKIAGRYLSTWFTLDILIVALDWMTVIGDSQRSGTAMIRMGKAFRGLRVLRSMRLLRIAKFMHLLEDLQDRIACDGLLICLSVVRLIVVLMVMSHVIACIWWGVGRSAPEGESSWIEYHGFENEEFSYRYLSSVHWTLTQFTPAGMEVFPHNSLERAFAVVILLFALIFFSSFLSSITAAMTQLRKLNNATNQQFSLLRRFLKERQIPQELSIRIRRYLEHRVQAQKARVQEHDIGMLVLLSEPLYKELQERTHKPILCNHPFFDHYCAVSPDAMRELCHSAISAMSLSEGDVLFSVGAKCERMIFVSEGKLVYSWVDSSSQNAAFLEEGSWCSEACLWADWVHRGNMHAAELSQLIAIDAAKFISTTKKQTNVIQSTARYSQQFVKALNKQLPAGACINDLSIPRGEIEEMCTEAFSCAEDEHAPVLKKLSKLSMSSMITRFF
jgi:hypothetical protein